jgi:hypothetical protein
VVTAANDWENPGRSNEAFRLGATHSTTTDSSGSLEIHPLLVDRKHENRNFRMQLMSLRN